MTMGTTRRHMKILDWFSGFAINNLTLIIEESKSLSLEQVTDIIDGKLVLGKPQEIREVRNAYEAYELILIYDPYSTRDFLKAHKIMTQDLTKEAGSFRKRDVGIFDDNGNVVHMGARPQYVHSLIKDLFDWAKADKTPEIIKSCVIHYEIEVIHPFSDGNGRLGRLWQNVILTEWNQIFAWIPIETIIYENQQGYYDAISLANKNNDGAVFIEFMLTAIHETLL